MKNILKFSLLLLCLLGMGQFGFAQNPTQVGQVPVWNGTVYAPKSGVGPLAEGRAVLVAGTVTVSTPAASSTNVFILTNCVTGGTAGLLSVGTVTAGTSFVINSASATDTSTVCWMVH